MSERGKKCCCFLFLRNIFFKIDFQNLKSGTTAVVALIVNRTLYVAWTGDSQAVLFESRGAAKQLTPCHDTKNEVNFNPLHRGADEFY